MDFARRAVAATAILIHSEAAWGQGATQEAFLHKRGTWKAHPATTAIKVGPATLVMVKGDQRAIRVEGHFQERKEKGMLVYDWMWRDGFFAALGRVAEKDGATSISFYRVEGVMTVRLPGAPSSGPPLPKPCIITGTLSKASVITCDGKRLSRAKVTTSFESIEGSLPAKPGSEAP